MSRQGKSTPRNTKKFLFDVHNFDEPETEDGAEAEPPPPSFSAEDLALARQAAYDQGKNDGVAEAQQSFEKQVLDTLNIVRSHFNILFAEEENRSFLFEKESVQLAGAIFAQAFPALNEKYGLAEVESVIKNVLETVREMPGIAIEVPPAYVDAVQSRIDGVLRQEGGPRCVVRASDHLGPGQCRMIWVNGTAFRNGATLAEQIREKIEQVLADRANLIDNKQRVTGGGIKSGDGHE